MSTMQFIGEFGEERAPIDAQFGWLGARFRIHPDASDLGFMEFMEQARGIEIPTDIDMNDPKAMLVALNSLTGVSNKMYEFIRGQIHPDDWDRFMEHAKAKRQQSSDLMRLSNNLTAAIARFPTGQSSDSAPRQESEKPKSTDGSFLAGRRERRAAERAEANATTRRHKVEEAALAELQGRPDLKFALLQQRRAQDAADAEAAATG